MSRRDSPHIAVPWFSPFEPQEYLNLGQVCGSEGQQLGQEECRNVQAEGAQHATVLPAAAKLLSSQPCSLAAATSVAKCSSALGVSRQVSPRLSLTRWKPCRADSSQGAYGFH